jgi:hypothetical protein
MAENQSPSILDEVLTQWEPHRGLTAPPPQPIQLWVRDGRIIYVEETWGPAVPYPPVDHGDGAKNHGYVRLKGNASAISQIPEAQKWPELGQFLEVINATASPVESVGCERRFFPAKDAGAATAKLGSYVDVIFTDAALNEHPEKLLLLAAHLMAALEGCDKWWASVEIGLQRFRHITGANSPWGLMLRVCNHGRSEDEARKFWGESLRRLGAAVSRLPRDLGQAG